MQTVSSNELIDGVSEEKSMIDIILQSGQAIGGSRRPWLQRGSQRGQLSIGNTQNVART